jgi:hypothetical protein
MPVALTEFFGAVVFRTKKDLSTFSLARIVPNITTAGVAGSKLRAQYSTDQITWHYMDGSAGPSVTIDATGVRASSWVSLTTNAKADVFLRAVGLDGDGAIDPVFGITAMEFK